MISFLFIVFIIYEKIGNGLGRATQSLHENYDTKEKEQFDEKFSIRVAVGVGAILIGFLIGMNGENFPMAVGMTEDFYYGIFMVFVAAGAGVLVHTGIVALICKNY